MESRLLRREEIDETAWDRFVDASPQQYLYYYSWYLDAVCPGWSAVIVMRKAEWVAVMPLPLRKKGPFQYAFQPPVTRFLGIIFCPADMARHSYYRFIKSASEKAIEALPPLEAFDQNLHPDLHYFLPFYWKKYKVEARLAYDIPLDGGFQSLEKNFSRSVSEPVKRARREGIAISLSDDESVILALLQKEGIYNEIYAQTFRRVWKEIRQRDMGFILHATGPEGTVYSAGAFIWDGERTIYYANVLDKSYKSSGANALLVVEAIRRSCERSGIRRFSFEGSMLEGVEQYLRAFNPEAELYLNVRKYRHPFLFDLYKRIFRNQAL